MELRRSGPRSHADAHRLKLGKRLGDAAAESAHRDHIHEQRLEIILEKVT